jgi:hypothetical protein
MAKRRRKRGLRGLGKLKRGGKVDFVRDLVPPMTGVALTMGSALGLRAYLRPTPGTASEMVYRVAPWVGVGVGALGGGLMWLLGGAGAAMSTFVTSLATGATLFGMERLHSAKPGAFVALSGGAAAGNGTDGLRAIVPEYSGGPFATRGTRGLNAIMMEQLNGNQQNQGADVQLRGVVNTRAFGARPYGA